MRIGGYRQRQAAPPRHMGRRVNQRRADAPAPKPGLHKQSIELSANHGSKTGDAPIDLGNEDLAAFDLLGRQVDRIRMSLEVRTVILVRQSGPTLQCFQRRTFLGLRRTDRQPLNGL